MTEQNPESPPTLIGRTLSGFRLLRHLGRGGMGEVYLAHEKSLGREVVLKFLAAKWTGDANLVKRFAREVRTAARLNHPNVVTIYSFHEMEGLTFYAMEYVEGRSLAEVIAREAPLDVGRALTVVEQVAEALACAHKSGIFHRDIKPSNISVTPSGLVKVLDFGIAKSLTADTDLTADGTFVGTLAYASPEQCEGIELDARTDVYSLGVVFYEMLAGRPPHTADTPLTLARRIVNEPPPDLETFNPQVPIPVKCLIGRMLEKQRDLRPGNGAAVADEIRRVRGEIEGVSLAPTAAMAGTPAPGLAPTDVAAPPPPPTRGAPLGRPVESREMAQPRTRRALRRALIWTVGVIVALAVLNRLGNQQGAKKTDEPPTPTAQTTPAPEATPSPALVQPTATPRSPWPTGTPARATPAPIRPAAALSQQTALQWVPADRDLVMMFNVRSLLQSQLIRSNESKVFSPEAIKNLDTFSGYFRVDWRRDVDSLLISGIAAKPETMCVTCSGRLDPPSIVAGMRAQAGYKVFTHNGQEIHVRSLPEQNRLEGVTFPAAGLAACGSLAVLQQVCEAAAGRSSVLTLPAVRNALPSLEGSPDFWILGVRQAGPTNPALATLDAWVLRGQLTPDLDLVGIAWPHDTSKIEAAYSLIRLVVEAWRNDKTNADLRKLGANIAVERSADTLSLRVRILYDDLVRLLDTAVAKGNYPFK